MKRYFIATLLVLVAIYGMAQEVIPSWEQYYAEKPADCYSCCQYQYHYERGADSVLSAGQFDVDHVNKWFWIHKDDQHATPIALLNIIKQMNLGGTITVYDYNTPATFGSFQIEKGSMLFNSTTDVYTFDIQRIHAQFNMSQEGDYCVSFDYSEPTDGLATIAYTDSVDLERQPYIGDNCSHSLMGTFPIDSTGFRYKMGYAADTSMIYVSHGNSGVIQETDTSMAYIDIGFNTAIIVSQDDVKGDASVEASIGINPIAAMFAEDLLGNQSYFIVTPHGMSAVMSDTLASIEYQITPTLVSIQTIPNIDLLIVFGIGPPSSPGLFKGQRYHDEASNPVGKYEYTINGWEQY